MLHATRCMKRSTSTASPKCAFSTCTAGDGGYGVIASPACAYTSPLEVMRPPLASIGSFGSVPIDHPPILPTPGMWVSTDGNENSRPFHVRAMKLYASLNAPDRPSNAPAAADPIRPGMPLTHETRLSSCVRTQSMALEA